MFPPTGKAEKNLIFCVFQGRDGQLQIHSQQLGFASPPAFKKNRFIKTLFLTNILNYYTENISYFRKDNILATLLPVGPTTLSATNFYSDHNEAFYRVSETYCLLIY